MEKDEKSRRRGQQLLEEHNPQRPPATSVQVHQPSFLNRVYYSFVGMKNFIRWRKCLSV
ncbi:hypothetical protein YC2023_053362 [Brassica napus]